MRRVKGGGGDEDVPCCYRSGRAVDNKEEDRWMKDEDGNLERRKEEGEKKKREKRGVLLQAFTRR
jgi:hypothetical protein